MSKSLGNGIGLRDSDGQIAAKVRAARTDARRLITFEPDRRPEVANLVRIAALCAGRDPVALADEIGGGGAAALKAVVVDSITALLAPIRERRAIERVSSRCGSWSLPTGTRSALQNSTSAA